MASTAQFGKGTLLQVETAVAGVYQTIPQCRNITPPVPDPEEEDITNQDSTGAGREFERTLIDFGEVATECIYIPTNAVHQQCIADAQSSTQVSRNFRILFVGGTQSVDFAGWVKSFERNLPYDAVYKANLRIRVTGLPTENPSP